MDSSIAILITSRNNYGMMDKFWAPRINNGKYQVLNIDEDSSKDQKIIGQDICTKYGFAYMDRDVRGIHNNVTTAIKKFGPKIKFIVWFQTDCWPIQEDFFHRFENLVNSGHLDDFGIVGFNGMGENILERKNYLKMLKKIKKNKMPIGVVARSPLETGDQWYCGVKSRRIKQPIPDIDDFRKPFAVAIVAWFAAGINVSKFTEHIDTTHPFQWFRSWDDICCQFLQKNIYNVTLPSFYVDHRPDLKPEGGSPKRAVRLAYKKDDSFHSLIGFTEKEWKAVWGFEYDNRETFIDVKERYRDTLLYKFYKHDPQKGPLKTFDF